MLWLIANPPGLQATLGFNTYWLKLKFITIWVTMQQLKNHLYIWNNIPLRAFKGLPFSWSTRDKYKTPDENVSD